MIVVMRIDSGEEQSAGVLQRIESFGLQSEVIHGEQRKVIAVLGQVFPDLLDELATMDGVDQVLRVSRPYKLASREVRESDTVVDLAYGVSIGNGRPVVMAGPCAIESEEQLWETATAVRQSGAHILRGGAFKPRTSPYSFRGLGLEALEMLKRAGREHQLPVITDCSPSATWTSSRSTRTYCRSARATCRTTCCSPRPARPASP